jgi:hypothetical protein
MHTIKQEEENDNKIKFVGKQNFANKKNFFQVSNFYQFLTQKEEKLSCYLDP